MKEIILSKNKGITLVDDENYEWLNKYKWYLDDVGYARSTIKSKNKRIHRLIMNEPKDMEIDHIDGNRLNNQKNNLRIVTRSQNNMNRLKVENCTSKFKGVCWNKRDKIWFAQIKINKKRFYLGNFKIEEEAAGAYNKAAIELFGEYACLNEV